jgi:hypothetical protein
MRVTRATRLVLAASLLAGLFAGHWAFGNGGPFVVKYPSGDPAAKGVLARLDPTLKPAQETRLRVVKEDLTVRFKTNIYSYSREASPPLVEVTAAYSIENPTGEEVQVDFGFPILRGIFVDLNSMSESPPAARITVDKESIRPTLISNSAIYGLIRQKAREVIEKGIAADAELASLVAAARAAWVTPPPVVPIQQPVAQQAVPRRPARPTAKPEQKPTAEYPPAREKLRDYLTATLRWNERDAGLLVEYASLDLGAQRSWPRDRWSHGEAETHSLQAANLGPLAAIGEQKATQMFAQLASRFDKEAAGTYEAIFAAWGGDVRERSIDMQSGEVRPREVNLPPPVAAVGNPAVGPRPDLRLTADPTVYARVDYLDPNAKLTAEEKASCQAVLKNLPVVFTFAPMNLLHYQVKFPARSTRLVTVSYSQYAAADTRGSGSYQLAYVLHPATLWKEFGPINLAVHVPEGIACKASAAIEKIGAAPPPAPGTPPLRPGTPPMELYQATFVKPEEKSGELFLAVDKAAWDKLFPAKEPRPTPTAKRAVPLRSNPPAQPAAQARPQRAAVGP